MTAVLLGRVPPPVDHGVSTLMEVADAYHGRAREMEMILLRLESDGAVIKNSKAYKFRTGELRSFIELVKGARELGSRRITALSLEVEMEG